MNWRAAMLSVLCGIAWHVLVMLLLTEGEAVLLSPLLPAGGLAGLVAGGYTVWSRRRNGGRERVLHVVANYYIGVWAYAVFGAVLHTLVGDGLSEGWSRAFAGACIFVYYATMIATVAGVLLIPLCWLTRLIVWDLSGSEAPVANAQGQDPRGR